MKKIIMTDVLSGLTLMQSLNGFSVIHKYGVFNGDLNACLKFWDKLELTDDEMAYALHHKKIEIAA